MYQKKTFSYKRYKTVDKILLQRPKRLFISATKIVFASVSLSRKLFKSFYRRIFVKFSEVRLGTRNNQILMGIWFQIQILRFFTSFYNVKQSVSRTHYQQLQRSKVCSTVVKVCSLQFHVSPSYVSNYTLQKIFSIKAQ